MRKGKHFYLTEMKKSAQMAHIRFPPSQGGKCITLSGAVVMWLDNSEYILEIVKMQEQAVQQ